MKDVPFSTLLTSKIDEVTTATAKLTTKDDDNKQMKDSPSSVLASKSEEVTTAIGNLSTSEIVSESEKRLVRILDEKIRTLTTTASLDS
jgi:hypothetical protein